jgi:hypothetical protein
MCLLPCMWWRTCKSVCGRHKLEGAALWRCRLSTVSLASHFLDISYRLFRNFCWGFSQPFQPRRAAQPASAPASPCTLHLHPAFTAAFTSSQVHTAHLSSIPPSHPSIPRAHELILASSTGCTKGSVCCCIAVAAFLGPSSSASRCSSVRDWRLFVRDRLHWHVAVLVECGRCMGNECSVAT